MSVHHGAIEPGEHAAAAAKGHVASIAANAGVGASTTDRKHDDGAVRPLGGGGGDSVVIVVAVLSFSILCCGYEFTKIELKEFE